MRLFMKDIYREYNKDRFEALTYNRSLNNRCPAHYHKQIELFYVLSETQNENYRSPLSIQDVAEHCNYNKYYISRIFNSTFNCNLNNYIDLRRLEALIDEKSLHPDRSTQEIAVKVGFPTERTFYRVFKSTYGCTPKEFFSSSLKNVNN